MFRTFSLGAPVLLCMAWGCDSSSYAPGGSDSGTGTAACNVLASAVCQRACACTDEGTDGLDRCRVEIDDGQGLVRFFGINTSGCEVALSDRFCNVETSAVQACQGALSRAACGVNSDSQGFVALPGDACTTDLLLDPE